MPIRKSNEALYWIELALRLALGGFFAWSGWMKVFSTGLDNFTRAVGNYKLVNPPLDAVVAYTVPWVEMIVGICLVLGIWKRGALLVLAGLVGAFAFGVRHAWVNNLNISCGCTGNPDGTPMDYTMKFWEFGGYWAAILLLFWLGRKQKGHVFGGTKMQLPGGS
ncbi:MAG: hypothetical protein B9S38_00660 [Verrucomicrobiia bacterium Tous-C4TDCM]|nr:MAG: hypothetical protein B9S38_00660 [Verrucomicrobiae bacterium Tous-C4TDCM]